MISSPRAWTLEQNDRRLVFSTGADATLFAESGGTGVARHHHPVWKVVLPVGGHVRIGREGRPPLAAAGLLVPPQLTHTCAVTSPYAALFIDPWRLRAGTGPVRLDADAVRRLLAALGPGDADGLGSAAGDLTAACSELIALTGAAPAPRLDERVAHAVRTAGLPGPDGSIGELAAEVGLSPSRLRALVRESVGIPLVRLRQWGRLRNAVAGLPHASVATAAAAAGFADQAHLTRTSRTLLGRTPASLGRAWHGT